MTAISNHIETIIKLNPDYTQMDSVYLTNKLLNLIGDAALELPGDPDPLNNLDLMVKAAQTNGKIADSQAARQILEAQLMDFATPTPSRINQLFWDKYQAGPRAATDWFFALSRANNYIQTRAIAKNLVFPAKTSMAILKSRSTYPNRKRILKISLPLPMRNRVIRRVHFACRQKGMLAEVILLHVLTTGLSVSC